MAGSTSLLKAKKDRKPVQCPVCKVFRSGDLSRHMRVHAAANIPCDHAVWGCRMMFRQNSNMRMHVNSVHFKQYSYPCPHWWVDMDGVLFPCRHKYKDASSLHRHRRSKHGYRPGDGPEKIGTPTRMGTRFSQIRAQQKPSAPTTEWTDVNNSYEYQGRDASSNVMDPFHPALSVTVDDAAVDDIVRSLSSSSSSSRIQTRSSSLVSGSQDISALISLPQSPVAKIENGDGNDSLLHLQGGVDIDQFQFPTDPYGTLQFGHATTDWAQLTAQIPPQTVQPVPQPWAYTQPGVVPVLDDPAAYGAPTISGSCSVNMAPIPDASPLAAHYAALYEQERIRMWMGTGMGGVDAGPYTLSPPSSRGSPVTPYVQGYSPWGGYCGGGSFDGVVVPPSMDNSFGKYYQNFQ